MDRKMEYEMTYNGEGGMRFATAADAIRAIGDDVHESNLKAEVGADIMDQFFGELQKAIDAPERRTYTFTDPSDRKAYWMVEWVEVIS